MLLKWLSKTATERRPAAAPAATSGCTIEPLESRQFLSATLKVENLDIIPGFERMVFNKVGIPHPTVQTVTKTTGKLKLTNTGNATLTFSNVLVSGPFKLLNAVPATLAKGASVTITVQFTATNPPSYTYNQTAGPQKPTSGGVFHGGVTFKTNDPANPSYREAFAGYYQKRYEDNQEPGLQTIVNLMMDYKTNIASSKLTNLTQSGNSRTLYGEEVNSAYWTIANTAKPVGVREIAAFKGMTTASTTGWYKKSDKVYKELYKTDNRTNQSLLPSKLGQLGVAAHGTFAPAAGTVFGFKIDKEYSDDKLNKVVGGGHHVRFYPLRDHFGNVLANTYLMTMDYSDANPGMPPNYDFQDNVYVVTNVKPAGN